MQLFRWLFFILMMSCNTQAMVTNPALCEKTCDPITLDALYNSCVEACLNLPKIIDDNTFTIAALVVIATSTVLMIRPSIKPLFVQMLYIVLPSFIVGAYAGHFISKGPAIRQFQETYGVTF